MSRNEGLEESKLFVTSINLHEKANRVKRTLVREGMSACDTNEIGSTLQSKVTGVFKRPTDMLPIINKRCEFRQIYASLHSIPPTSHDQLTCGAMPKLEGTLSKTDGSQFRQIYPSLSLREIHSQKQQEHIHRMPTYQYARSSD